MDINILIEYVAVAILSALVGWLIRKNKLPKSWKKWLDKKAADGTTLEQIIRRYVQEAQYLAVADGAARKKWVMDRVMEWAPGHIGTVPPIVLEALVEMVYWALKERKRK